MGNNQSIIDVIFAHLSEPFGKSFFETAASILATAIVLFFTLVLIPIQQFVNRYSPSLLRYFRRDWLTISLMVVVLVSLFNPLRAWSGRAIFAEAFVEAVLLALSFV